MLNPQRAAQMVDTGAEVLADVVDLATYKQAETARIVYRRLEIAASAGNLGGELGAGAMLGGLLEMRRQLRKAGAK